jgi:5-methylcytosine-specific restriction protein A
MPSHRNPPWARDELILTLDLYFRVNPLHTSESHPEIRELGAFLNLLPIHADRPDQEVFRNPKGVYMKLCNFLRFDPSYHGSRLTRGGKAKEEIWSEFSGNKERLRSTADTIRALGTSLSPAEVAGDVADLEEEASEGRILMAIHKRRERNPGLTRKKKAHILQNLGALECEACGFDFSRRYGDLGVGFAECHHRTPIAALANQVRTKLPDLVIVCANCHRMIHRPRPMMTVQKLREILSWTDA